MKGHLPLVAAVWSVALVASVQAAAVSFDPSSGYTASFGSTQAAGWSGYADTTALSGSIHSVPANFSKFTDCTAFDNTYVQGDATKSAQRTLYGVRYPNGSSNNWGLCVSPSSNAAMAIGVLLTPNADLVNPTISVTYRVVGAGGKQDSGYNDLPGLYCLYSTDGGATWTRIQSLDSNTEAGKTTQTNGFNWQDAEQGFPVAGIPDTALGATRSFTQTLTGVSMAAGGTIEFRWFENNSHPYSPEANVAITGFGVNSVPEPSVLAPLGLAAWGLWGRRRKTA